MEHKKEKHQQIEGDSAPGKSKFLGTVIDSDPDNEKIVIDPESADNSADDRPEKNSPQGTPS